MVACMGPMTSIVADCDRNDGRRRADRLGLSAGWFFGVRNLILPRRNGFGIWISTDVPTRSCCLPFRARRSGCGFAATRAPGSSGLGAVRVSLRRKAVFPVHWVNDVTAGFLVCYSALPSAFSRQNAPVGRLAVGSRLTVAGTALDLLRGSLRPWMGRPLQGSMPRASLCANRPARTPETGHSRWYPGCYGQASGRVGEFLSESRNGRECNAVLVMD